MRVNAIDRNLREYKRELIKERGEGKDGGVVMIGGVCLN